MPESLPKDLAELRDRADAFARAVLVPNGAAMAAGNADAQVRANVTRAAREAGFFAMTQPRSVGGSEAGPLALTVARQLQRSGGRYALVSLCIGGGQGMAVILERV